jgi:hypothetical protein
VRVRERREIGADGAELAKDGEDLPRVVHRCLDLGLVADHAGVAFREHAWPSKKPPVIGAVNCPGVPDTLIRWGDSLPDPVQTELTTVAIVGDIHISA